jgi:calpain-7
MQVVIDDTLPQTTNPDVHLCATVVRDVPSTGDPELDAEAEETPIKPELQQAIDIANAWVPLVEKAYMRLHSGYDFPGSIPSLDLYTLTSWIPERLQFNSPGFRRERTWKRLIDGQERGTCLIALGTGRNVRGTTGLAPLHAYGVSQVWEEIDGRRRVRVDNPWKRNRPADIVGTTSHTEWARDLRNTLVEEEHTPRKPVPCGIQGVLQSTLKNRPADTLIFSWDEICNRFETLELNWNPQLFANMKDLHS